MDKPSILEAVDILKHNNNKVEAFVSIYTEDYFILYGVLLVEPLV